jgi:hypothetical protein
LYKVVATKVSASPDAVGMTNFKVSIDWDKLGGGTNHESIVYGVKLN